MSPRIHERGRSGNYMMMMALFLPVVIGFAALSVDISYINMAASQSQHVADAASHAAFITYRDTASKDLGVDAAEWIVAQNKVGNGTATLDSIEWGEWDYDNYTFSGGAAFTNSAQAIVSRTEANSNPLTLFFAPILGVNKASVSGAGVTAGRSREMMLVTDVSGSFREEIPDVKQAIHAFIDYLEENRFPEDKIGNVLFSGRDNFPPLHDLMYTTPTNVGVMREQTDKLDVCYNMTGALRGAPTANSAKRASNGQVDCWTSQARGLHEALQEFQLNGDHRQFQGIVLLTDGQANTHLVSSSNGSTAWRAEDDAEMLRDVLWNGGPYNYNVWECPIGQATVNSACRNQNYSGTFTGGVHLWAVYVGNSGYTNAWLSSLVDHHAGNAGYFRSTSNSNELTDIFIEIASSIPVVLTK